MLCQRCKKNEASIHVTDVSEGAKDEIHLCQQCAQKEGVTLKGHVSLADFLSGLIKAPVTKEMARLSKLKCPVCGINYIEFQSKGRLGCPKDYEVFEDLVSDLLEKIHGSTKHVGKTPQPGITANTAVTELESLKEELAKAIADERYEEAAHLRDRIREMGEHSSGP